MATATDLAVAAVWLEEKARFKRPVGVAVDIRPKGYRIAFADLLDKDEVEFGGKFGDAGCDILAQALGVWTEKPQLVANSQPVVTGNLAQLTGLAPRVLADRFLGDMQALHESTGSFNWGNTVTFTEAAREALRDWRGAQQYPLPRYYETIAKPLQRLRSLGVEDGNTWEVDYSELWLRVLAFYSHDPQLSQALITESAYPAYEFLTTQLRTVYDDVLHSHAFACLVLAALGGDLPYMKVNYTDLAALIEELGDVEPLLHHLDRMIPSVRLMATGLATPNTEGVFETLYGRRLPFRPHRGGGPGYWLDFILAGTVRDITNVLMVTLANQGASVDATPIPRPLTQSIRIKGTTKERDMVHWIGQLRGLSTLGGPLAPIPLNAVVGRGDA